MAKPPPPRKKKQTLLTLPREIRDIIYGHACDGEVLGPRPASFSGSDHGTSDVTLDRNTGMLLACSQMQNEAKTIYYSTMTFIFSNAATCMNWLIKLREELVPLLRYIRIVNVYASSRYGNYQPSLLYLSSSDEEALYTIGPFCTWEYQCRLIRGKEMLSKVNETIEALGYPQLQHGAMYMLVKTPSYRLEWMPVEGGEELDLLDQEQPEDAEIE